MQQPSRSLLRAAACAAALAAGPVLTGCSGVVKNLNSAQVNAPSLNLSNPFGADSKPAAMLVVASPVVDPAVVTAHAAREAHASPPVPPIGPNVSVYPFTRQSAGSLSSVSAGTASVSFNVNPAVTVDGATLPATFTLKTISIASEADDLNATPLVADSVTLPPLSSAAPVVFTQSAPGSSTYNAAGAITLATGAISGTTLSHLFTIVTGEDQNKQAILTLEATSADLPAGTLIHITLGSSTLNIKAN